MKLTVIIPTRGRPSELKQTIEILLRNATRFDTMFLLCVDDDDLATLAMLDQLPHTKQLRISVEPREDSRGEKYDRALTWAPADVYLPMCDVTPIVTHAFDQLIVNAASLFPDQIGCVYTAMANHQFPTLLAPTARLVELMGGIYPDVYPFWFIDHELDDICRMIQRYVFVNIMVDAAARRPPRTIRMHDVAFWATYCDFRTLHRRDLALKIIDHLDEAEWRKIMLRSCYGPIEARSRTLLAEVVKNAAEIERLRGELSPPDNGYLRIKRRAEEAMAKREGYLSVDHRASPGLPADVARAAGFDPAQVGEGKLMEAATLTCAHCRVTVVKNPLRTRERKYCPKCSMRYVCDWCAVAMDAPDYQHAQFEKVADTALDEGSRGIPLALSAKLNALNGGWQK